MRVLITGASGMLGTHLGAYLQAHHPEVRVFPATRADLSSPQAARSLVERLRPERAFHLGAQSSVHKAVDSPLATLKSNLLTQRYLLEALCAHPCPVLVVGSAEEYGQAPPGELPYREDSPLRPLSIYAVSKVGQDLMGLQFFKERGLSVVRVRSFNHTGPLRRDCFVESSLARQLARIEKGLEPPLVRVGNLEARRDFSDARDAVRAYWLVLEKGRPGEVYNVCSGRSRSVRELLDLMLERTRVKVTVEVDPHRLRPADVPELLGCPVKIREATGWKAEIPLEQTLTDLMDYWRANTP